MRTLTLSLLAIAALLAVGCSDDMPPAPGPWQSDSLRILFNQRVDDTVMNIHSVRLDGSDEKTLYQLSGLFSPPVRGKFAFARASSLGWRQVEIAVGSATPGALAHRVAFDESDANPHLIWCSASLSEDQRTVVFVRHDDVEGIARLYAAETTGGTPRLLAQGVLVESTPRISPDSRRVAFYGQASRKFGLWVVNLDGSGLQLLADSAESTPDAYSWLCWSPDGTRIAFRSNVESGRYICVVNADGTGLRRVSSTTEEESNPDWSHDGRYIAYEQDYRDGERIMIVPADGSSEPYPATNGSPYPAATYPAWSFDDSKIACITGTSQDDVYLATIDVRTKVTTVLKKLNTAWRPFWSR